jgi:hypothetical protein
LSNYQAFISSLCYAEPHQNQSQDAVIIIREKGASDILVAKY